MPTASGPGTNGAGERVQALVTACDVLLVVGTSGVVWPAAGLSAAARQAGKWVGEINPEPTPLAGVVHSSWRTTAAQGLSQCLAALGGSMA